MSFPHVERTAYFRPPEKRINSQADVVQFGKSIAFDRIMAFILLLNDAISGKTLDLYGEPPAGSNVAWLRHIFTTLNLYLDETPPNLLPRRFGNTAFRDWVMKLERVGREIRKDNDD